MRYNSTRSRGFTVTAAQAISRGISPEGGLFVPETIPFLGLQGLESLKGMGYQERAKAILSLFLTDFTKEELDWCVGGAYTTQKFDSDAIAEIARVGEGRYLLELWHGPTCAFKDMALQILPYLMTVSAKKAAADKEIVVLVATSGDTGKAALEGFKDVPGTRMLVFYPEDGVSPMQKRQMATQEGENLSVCAIKGNFDDAQTGVKKIFTDPEVIRALEEKGMIFSSANSINWGRLLPQIVYYVSAYLSLVEDGELQMGETLNVAVPTGNFGNILAAYYAKKMGVPLGKLICASNENNVLTDFLTTGTYDRNRPFHTTISPSMDILISSNLERLLYDLSGEDDAAVAGWFKSLNETGRYTVSDKVKAAVSETFAAGFCTDQEALSAIGETFGEYGYLCDPHTAVAVKVCGDYQKKTGDKAKVLIASTASPYKFTAPVLQAVSGGEAFAGDEFAAAKQLQAVTGVPIPGPIQALEGKAVRFTGSVPKEEMVEKVLEMLK